MRGPFDPPTSIYDFTPFMRYNDNMKVNELCECSGSEKTVSRRINRRNHAESCSYRIYRERSIAKFKADMGVA